LILANEVWKWRWQHQKGNPKIEVGRREGKQTNRKTNCPRKSKRSMEMEVATPKRKSKS